MKPSACPSCDLLVELPDLEDGQDSSCPRCNHTLETNSRGGWQKRTALATASLILLFFSMAQPFMTLRSPGGDQSMSLLKSSFALYQEDHVLLSIIVAAIFIVLPGTYLIGLLIIALAKIERFPLRVSRTFARLIFHMREWAMPDVFLVGALISLIKIAKMARVEFGFSFWSFIIFTIAFVTTVGSIDERRIIHQLADRE